MRLIAERGRGLAAVVPRGILARWHAVASEAGHYQRVLDVEDYAGLNVRARLAAGLLTVEAWLGRYQIEDEGTAAVLDHVWQFMTVTPETFQDWHDFEPEALIAAETEEALLPSAAAACRRHGARAEDLATMLADVISIVYDSLFGALDLSLSMARLREIAAVAARSGIAIPDASRFGHLPAREFHGWGNPVSAAQLAGLRSRTDLG